LLFLRLIKIISVLSQVLILVTATTAAADGVPMQALTVDVAKFMSEQPAEGESEE
jgi:hypothetical protein